AASGFFDVDRYFVMSEYCENMTEKAKNGEYHDFFMRDDKIETLTDILSLGAKSNPCIVGNRGVGKTALVEGLAYRIANGHAPEKIKNKKLYKINIAKLIVGKSGVGSSPLTRLRAILNKAELDKNIILFIDNIYQISKIPGASELIKTYLDKGNIKIIVSATGEEYSDMLKNDSLAQDYTCVFIEEPSKFDTFRILRYLKNDIEKKQNVKLFDEVLMDIINLTGRYMKNKCYPNKAVDIMNLALVSAQKDSESSTCILEHENIVDAISEVTNMPIGDLSADEAEALETMNDRVKKLIVGQENAVNSVCSSVKRSRLGMCDENRPRASFLFVGRSGVGKSELSRVIGGEIGSFISVDMLGLGHKDSLKKLIGSSESKSELIEKITKNPYSVVMFDNVNLANDEALAVIYEILDRGFMTDFSGKKVDFTNAIIILTADSNGEAINGDSAEDKLYDFLKKNFKGSLWKNVIKKLTDVVAFNDLSEENYNFIVRTKISELESRLQSLEISIKISNDVISYICKLCCDEKNSIGAGIIDKIIHENIERPISDLMTKRKLRSGEQVFCVLENEKIKFKMEKDL
ncbi:MAG: AAA family ATPase, partial [Clostridia bacterium]|nr:AAA family ATPase [Clostridia bacterium]